MKITAGISNKFKLLFVAVAALQIFLAPVEGALVTVDLILPIAKKEGSDQTIVGAVPINTPLSMSFTYDPLAPTSVFFEPSLSSYYFFGAGTEAVLQIGDISWHMTSLQIDVRPHGVIGTSHGVKQGYLMSFYASTLPSPLGVYYGVASAFLVWPEDTIPNITASLPEAPPSIVTLSAIVDDQLGHRALFGSSEYPDPAQPPLSPVPEPSTYGLTATLLLVGLCGWRYKKFISSPRTWCSL